MTDLERYKKALELACETAERLGYNPCMVGCKHLDKEHDECTMPPERECDKKLSEYFLDQVDRGMV